MWTDRHNSIPWPSKTVSVTRFRFNGTCNFNDSHIFWAFYRFIGDFAETYRLTTFQALAYPIALLCFPLLMLNTVNLNSNALHRTFNCDIFVFPFFFFHSWMQSLSNGNTNGIIHSFFLIVVIVNYTFIYCYVGDRLTSKFEHLGQSIYEIKWQLLPPILQKSIQLMILSTQRPVYMDSFAGLRCTRQVFEMVWQSNTRSMQKKNHNFSFEYTIF